MSILANTTTLNLIRMTGGGDRIVVDIKSQKSFAKLSAGEFENDNNEKEREGRGEEKRGPKVKKNATKGRSLTQKSGSCRATANK